MAFLAIFGWAGAFVGLAAVVALVMQSSGGTVPRPRAGQEDGRGVATGCIEVVKK